MLKRQFIVNGYVSNIVKEDYQKIEKRGKRTVLYLKENILEGYAERIDEVLNRISLMQEAIIPSSITKIKVWNNSCSFTSSGEDSSETLTQLATSIMYNTAFFDNEEVNVQITGQLIPFVANKGYYKACFEERCFSMLNNLRKTYCGINGQDLEPVSTNELGFSTYEEDLAVCIVSEEINGTYYITITYVGVNPITGQEIKNVLISKLPYSGINKMHPQIRKYTNQIENLIKETETLEKKKA